MPKSSPKIMLATDFSARCDRARARVFSLARQLQGKIIIAHVAEHDPHGKDAEYDKQIANFVEDQYASSDLPVDTLILRGPAPQALAEAALETGCDVIVTGVARYNSLRDHVLGTAVDYLVRNSPVPVLVVKNWQAERSYEKVLVAVDLSTCSRAALTFAGEFLPNANINVVYAYHVPFESLLSSDQVAADVREEAEEELDSFLHSHPLTESILSRVEAQAISGDLTTVVDQQLTSAQPDLVVLGTHGKSGFAHATIGSRAAELLAWLPTDVLMVRKNK